MIETVLTALQALNWAEWTGVLAAFLIAFERLAKVTPSQTDNKIVRGLYKLFAFLGVKVEDRKK